MVIDDLTWYDVNWNFYNIDIKRPKTITSFFQAKSSEESNSVNQDIGIGTGIDTREIESNVILDPNDIVHDPGLRKPIEELNVNVRDAARREYLLLGPFQPKGHTFSKKKIGDKNRSFQESWFKKYEWLEYSVDKDAAFLFFFQIR